MMSYFEESKQAEEVTVLWLMQNTFESCDDFDLSTFEGWQKMFAKKTSDTGFSNLVDSMLEHGFLKDSAIGFYEGEITEGHHRLCAAILLGMETVWISRWGRSCAVPGIGNLSAHMDYDFDRVDFGVDI